MYAMGVGVNASQAKALIYYTFAALGEDHRAQVTAAAPTFPPLRLALAFTRVAACGADEHGVPLFRGQRRGAVLRDQPVLLPPGCGPRCGGAPIGPKLCGFSHTRRLPPCTVEDEVQTVGAPVVERQRISRTGAKRPKTMASADVVQYYQYNADRSVRARALASCVYAVAAVREVPWAGWVRLLL
jgi:SEL1 protein